MLAWNRNTRLIRKVKISYTGAFFDREIHIVYFFKREMGGNRVPKFRPPAEQPMRPIRQPGHYGFDRKGRK